MTDMSLLLKENEIHANRYHSNALMKLIQSPEMAKKESRERLLDCIQVMSDYFQKTVMLRNVLCEDPKFLFVAQDHLQEEFGHNLNLMKDRKGRNKKWDPILESTASWFPYKMFTLDQEEKTVLIHLVLETSANIFFQAAHKVMTAYGETSYFKVHSEADEGHEQMGRELLTDLSPRKYERLIEIQRQGWSIMSTFCEHVAKHSIGENQ